MAGYVKQYTSEYVEGRYTLDGATSIKLGGFVTADYSDLEMDIPSGDTKGKVYFVINDIDHLVPFNVDDRDYAVAGGAYVKAKPVLDMEIFITDMFGSTYGDISVDDEMGVGADGKLYLIAGLTASDFTTFDTIFTVVKKEKLYANDALQVIAKTGNKTA